MYFSKLFHFCLLNAIEKNKYNPSLELAFRLARLFEVKLEDIFIYEDENS